MSLSISVLGMARQNPLTGCLNHRHLFIYFTVPEAEKPKFKALATSWVLSMVSPYFWIVPPPGSYTRDS